MVIIAVDTNFVAPRILRGGKQLPEVNLLDRLLFLQSKGKIKLSFPKTIQAEVYAILRAGRMKFKSQSTNKRAYKKPPHQSIMGTDLLFHYDEARDPSLRFPNLNEPGISMRARSHF